MFWQLVFCSHTFTFWNNIVFAFFFTPPFCCDGLALLEQGLHALGLGVSLLASLLAESLLAGLLLFARLLFSLWLTTCFCQMFSLLRFYNFWSNLFADTQSMKDALTFIHDWRGDSRSEWRFCSQGCSVACGWDRIICLLVFHFFVLDLLIKSHKSVTGPVQRPRKRHFTPLGRNLLTASASRHSTQPPCQSPSWGAKSGEHNDMLIRWTCRNTHLTLDPRQQSR